jgi:hypothetical protein
LPLRSLKAKPAQTLNGHLNNKHRVDAAIVKMARMKPRFTADEIWYELGASFPVTKGMTARLMVAERRGVIKNTGEITYAKRGGQHDHAQRLTIWQSL